MRFLLHLKHWQVFIITFGLFPVAMILTFATAELANDYRWRGLDVLLWTLLISQSFCMVCTSCWFFAIGTHLHQRHYYNSFGLALFRYGIYASIPLSILSFVVFPIVGYHDFAFISLTFLMYLGMLIYCSLFAARLLKMAESRKDVLLEEFLREFLGFLFYPIGVWWLQPRINKIFEKDLNEFDPKAPLDQNINW